MHDKAIVGMVDQAVGPSFVWAGVIVEKMFASGVSHS